MNPEQYMQSVVQALGSKLFCAEPWFHSLNAVIPAVIGTQLNGQDFNVRLNFDLYIYGIGIASTGIFSFQLQDVSGGVLYSNAPVRSDSIVAGAAAVGLPFFPLYRPWQLKAKSDLLCNFTNAIAGANTVQVTLCCFKGQSQAGEQGAPVV